jgi:hypothetical protein
MVSVADVATATATMIHQPAMNAAILSLVLSVLGPGPDVKQIAPAIVHAVEWRADHGLAPVTGSPAEDAA